MKKKLLPLAIAAAMTPGFAAAADVSGFVDVMYNISSDSAPTTDGSFGAAAEVDFIASPADGVTTRVDVDFNLTPGTTGGADLEQAFFAWGATEGVTVIGGVFNNPIGMECGDAPCMWGTQSGIVGNALNGQTSNLNGNNLAGLAVAGDVGPATVTVAYVNELGGMAEENTFALVVNASPVEGLDLELGFATQELVGGTEGVTNINGSWAVPGVEGLSVGADILIGSEVLDTAYELMANYSMGDFGVGIRAEDASYAVGDSNSRLTYHASYQAASNLVAVLEVADGTVDNAAMATAVDGIVKDNVITLELIATF